MATVSTLVNLFGVSKHTIRAWSKEFSAHLSAGASPPLGERRNYNEGDIQVFGLIAHLRRQNAQYSEIHQALNGGEQANFVAEPSRAMVASSTTVGNGGVPATPLVGYAPVELIESFAKQIASQFHDQINQLRNEIGRLEKQGDYFRDKFEESQDELRNASATMDGGGRKISPA